MASADLATQPLQLPSTRQIARKLAVVAATLGAAAVLATQLPGLRDIGHELAGASGGWIAVALAFELASTACFAFVFHGVYDRRPSRRASTSLSMAVQGFNTVLPSGGAGGLAVGAVLLDRAGVPRSFAASRTVALFLVTSLVSFVAVVIAGLGVAGGALPGDAPLVLTLLPGLLALLVIVAVFALPRSGGAVDGVPAGRVRTVVASAREHLREGVGASAELLRAGDRLVIAGSIGYFLFDVAALAAAFHAVGSAGLPVALLVLAYTLGHGGALIPFPGSAEGGLIGMFVMYGMPLHTATAAVLAYRALHAGVPLVLGVIGLADARRLLRDRASVSGVPEPWDTVPPTEGGHAPLEHAADVHPGPGPARLGARRRPQPPSGVVAGDARGRVRRPQGGLPLPRAREGPLQGGAARPRRGPVGGLPRGLDLLRGDRRHDAVRPDGRAGRHLRRRLLHDRAKQRRHEDARRRHGPPLHANVAGQLSREPDRRGDARDLGLRSETWLDLAHGPMGGARLERATSTL
jgi:uncharacterized membrane protein YbhN (UPF0104 family)